MVVRIGFETAGVILECVVRLDTLSLFLANDVWRILLCEPLDLLSRRFGVRVENADDVGYVFVREARVLLPYSAWIEDVLCCWRGKSPS